MTIQLQKELNFARGKGYLDIDLSIEEGSLVAISGPSGSGKTSLLRLVAGLDHPTTGQIKIDGNVWLNTNQNINLPPQQRKVGFVFQQYTLFPNMTVLQNLEYALEKGQSPMIIQELLETMEVGTFKDKYAFQLSGGQQQRVALARALVRKPAILLLDEPLSALNDTLRIHLQNYILKIHKQYQLTILLVTHDIAEIFKMADRVVVLKEGKVDKDGTPLSVYFNNKESEAYQIAGKVVEIQKVEGVLQALVKVEEKIISIPLLQEQGSKIRVGDTILLSAKDLSINI